MNGMTFKEYLALMKKAWVGSRVMFEGQEYTVVDVDANGFLLIDKADSFKATTAVETTDVKPL